MGMSINSDPIKLPLIKGSITPKATAIPPPSTINQEASKTICLEDGGNESPPSIQNIKGGWATKCVKESLFAISKKASFALGVAVIYLGIALAGALCISATIVFGAIGATLGAPGHMPGVIVGLLLGVALGLKIGIMLSKNVLHYSEQLGNHLQGDLQVDDLTERLSLAFDIHINTD